MNPFHLLSAISLAFSLCMDTPPVSSFQALAEDDLFTNAFLSGIGYNLANIPEFIKPLSNTSFMRLDNMLDQLAMLKESKFPEDEDLFVDGYSFFCTFELWWEQVLTDKYSVQEQNLRKILQNTFAVTPELKTLVKACGFREFDLPFIEFLVLSENDTSWTDLHHIGVNLVQAQANALTLTIFLTLFRAGRYLSYVEVFYIYFQARYLAVDKPADSVLERLDCDLAPKGFFKALQYDLPDNVIMRALECDSFSDKTCVLLAISKGRSSELVKALIAKTEYVDHQSIDLAISRGYRQDVIDLLRSIEKQ